MGAYFRFEHAGGAGRPVPRVLLAAAEIHPFAKTGGLADMCAGLAQALSGHGADLRLLLPGYECALDQARAPRTVADLGGMLGLAPVRLLEATLPDAGTPVWLIDCPPLYRRPGSLYQDAQGEDWTDNWLRFGLLCHVAARLALGAAPGGWRPGVLHCHDWQTGLAPYLLAHAAEGRPRTLFTIHNAAFQGNFPPQVAARLGLPDEAMTPEGMEFWGRLSFLKAGLRYADCLNTVSAGYARELRTPEYGCGMEGLFQQRAEDLSGILNGIDTGRWNPRADPHIAKTYSAEAPQGKLACKADLQRRARLAEDPAAPVLAFVSRLAWQKMADVLLERLPALLARHPRLQFALLASGDKVLEGGFAQLAPQFPGRVSVRIGYDEPEEHRLHAGADVLLASARYEPCGLTQMIAMRYGALPVARRTGGLADTVDDAANGFLFDAPTADDMQAALDRCLDVYAHRPAEWRARRRHAMRGAYGWERSALAYLELYAGGAAPAPATASAGSASGRGTRRCRPGPRP